MIRDNDREVLSNLNQKIRKYKVKLEFQYYDVCPFNGGTKELLELVLEYVEKFEDLHNKIFILSSLCDEYYKDCIPYLVTFYHSFVKNVYKTPQDEVYLQYLCNTIARINAIEYIELYESVITNPMTQAAEPIIEMMSKLDVEKIDNIIVNLIKKENLIPNAWVGKLNEDTKYWCSLVALKCIANKCSHKYFDVLNSLIDDQNMEWIKLSESKYKDKLINSLKKQYKLIAEKGIKKIKH